MLGTRQKLALLLGATASMLTVDASAEINLDAAAAEPAGTVLIQSELDIGLGKTVTDVLGDLRVSTKIGAGFSQNEKIYARLEVFNGKFAAALDEFDFVHASDRPQLVNTVVALNGRKGDSWVVFASTVETGGIKQDAILNFLIDNVGIEVDDQNEVEVAYGLYESLSGARNGVGPVVEKNGVAVKFEPGIKIKFTQGDTVTADVEEDFKVFVGGAKKVSVGTIGFANSGARTFSDGTRGSANYSAKSVIEVAGDYSLAFDVVDPRDATKNAYSKAAVQLDADGCAGADGVIDATSVAAELASFEVDIANDLAADGQHTYSVCLTSVGDTQAEASSYSATFNGVAVAAAGVTPLRGRSGDLGAIDRNGVVVQLPYLTTFEGYRQRIIIVNRNATPVEIASMTFTPEEGTMATSKLTAEDMMIDAKKTKVLLVEDIVSLSGDRTRTAGTLSIVAKAGSIDVATQQVNLLGDGATDTVEYTAN